MRKTTHIPIHRLEERGKSNFEIHKIERGVVDLSKYPSDIEHRDDYYIFIYQESGNSNITVDFHEVILSSNSIFCIQPGQVHFGHFAPETSAWIISVVSEWIPTEFRLFLRETAIWDMPLDIRSDQKKRLFRDSLILLQAFEEQDETFSEQILKSMFKVCLHLFMQVFQQAIGGNSKNNLRPEVITREFKSLLLSNFRIMKSPAEYGLSLNITPAYLNEVVKETTGYSVSHWIHQEIILEAKRMLFYSNQTVKEIAHNLGYADAAYFIRLFRKIAGLPPLKFRAKYHKLSLHS